MTDVAIPRTRLTREDYRALPEGPPYYELVRGELIEMTRPPRGHQQILRLLIRLWDTFLLGGTRGELAPEPNLYLPGIEDVYHPDLVYVAQQRRPICRGDGVHGAPDVVCEILSPSTRRKDRYVKLEDFRRAGVPHVWLIEPESPVAVEEYVLDESGSYRLQALLSTPAEWEPVAFPGWRVPLQELEAAVAPVEDPAEPAAG